MENRVFVTSDAGRPWEIDPETLSLITPVAHLEHWKGPVPDWISTFIDYPLPVYMTTAHPGYDPNTGECFLPNGAAPPALLIESWVNLLRWDGG